MRFLKPLLLIIPIISFLSKCNAQEEKNLKFYAEAGVQRDLFENGYKYSNETFDDIYQWGGRKTGYYCKKNIGPYLSISSSYELLEFMDISIGINYFIFNMHYHQNSIDTLKKYYPNVITEDDEYFTIKDNYKNNFYLNVGPIFKIWHLDISPSIDLSLAMIDYWHGKRFNGNKVNTTNFYFLFQESAFFELRLGLKLGYEFTMFDRIFVINTGFSTNDLLLSLKMGI
jgi:hypothetical protein